MTAAVVSKSRALSILAAFGLLCVLLSFGLVAGNTLDAAPEWLSQLSAKPVPSKDEQEADSQLSELLAHQALPTIIPNEVQELGPDRARRINEETPFAKGPIAAAEPWHSELTGPDYQRARDCLASAMWYEAGGDDVGQRAVAQVVINRMRHPAFPNSVCGVVYQGSERRTGCQFTFTCDGALNRPISPKAWAAAQARAESMMNGATYPPVGLATHYHTDWVVPYWSGSLDKIARVGTHLFFRWPGAWGTSIAFRSKLASSEPIVAKLAALSHAHDAAALADVEGMPDAMATEAAGAEGGAQLALAAPPPPEVPAYRGGQITLVHPDNDAYVVELSPRASPSVYAMSAFALCKGRSFCKVMAWADPSAAPTHFPIGTDSTEKMTFVYILQDGKDYARWDCRQVISPPGRQCMPGTS